MFAFAQFSIFFILKINTLYKFAIKAMTQKHEFSIRQKQSIILADWILKTEWDSNLCRPGGEPIA
jgi:hypothetical protein